MVCRTALTVTRSALPRSSPHQEEPCSPLSAGPSVRRTCATRCCSRSRILALFRLGSTIPAPGVDYQNVHTCLRARPEQLGCSALVNLFSGGALLQLTVFALGIMPYITSSIIIQLLVVVIPRLERLKEQGQSGQAKLTQYTRYLTVALAILQATGIVALARSGRLLPCTDCRRQPDLAALLDLGLPTS